MIRVVEFYALGCATGTTFILALLSGGRPRDRAPRPETIVRTRPRDRQRAS